MQNSIFMKIKNWFYNLFHSHKEIEAPKEENNEKTNSNGERNYIEAQREKTQRHMYLIELQKRYKNGSILEEDLSEEDRIDLENLYVNQNNELKRKIKSLESKLVNNNS